MNKTINIALIGTGSVGSAFINYINKNKRDFTTRLKLKIKITAIANSRKMLFDKSGFHIQDWKKKLDNNGEAYDLKLFLSRLRQMKQSNFVLLDCTDGNGIAKHYKNILKSFSIVTPNKSANSGSYSTYKAFQLVTKKHKTDFRYSANTGVGLPTLDIIKNLIDGGDKILSIEGIFSSTMNFLLGQLLVSEKSFSLILQDAKKLKITEPDPRNDLNGIDTARKILILARESGAILELSDVKIQNLVPRNIRNTKSLSEFFDKIKSKDTFWNQLKTKVKKENKKLIYLAAYKNNNAYVKLRAVDKSHPFYNLSPKEKAVSIKTKFYSKDPLIIIGQSGGADATASVIFSDILKTVKN